MSTLPIENAKKYTDFDAIAELEDSAKFKELYDRLNAIKGNGK